MGCYSPETCLYQPELDNHQSPCAIRRRYWASEGKLVISKKPETKAPPNPYSIAPEYSWTPEARKGVLEITPTHEIIKELDRRYPSYIFAATNGDPEYTHLHETRVHGPITACLYLLELIKIATQQIIIHTTTTRRNPDADPKQ